MSHVPIRLRVTLAFTAAMALVLISVGLFVYLRLEAELDDSAARGPRSDADASLANEREENFDEALDSLAALFLVGGPAALLLASLAGYAATGSALRPVEAMRRRAAAISARQPGERLPVPAANDELRRLGQTLNEMLARIEATLDHERRFVDDASHELRTPLALHKAELELALRHGGSEKELRAAISSSLQEIDRLAHLAEDLLVVARSEEGVAIAPGPVRVGELFAALDQRFDALASESGRALAIGEDAGLSVNGDRARLEQVLTAMVDNAFRHGEGEVRLWAVASDEGVELHVGDRGGGFPAEFLPHAFERFSRADRARARGGSGLGLAIVEAIARAHGGGIGAANDPAGGADVWIVVPAA